MMTERTPKPPTDFVPPQRVDPEEARRISDAGDRRFEYWNGWLYPRGYPPGAHWAMAGGTKAHSRVIMRVHRLLDEHLETGPCTAYEDNVELHVSERDYFFPDAFVTCSPMGDTTSTSEWDAVLVIEVLSQRTAEFDRTTKFDGYKRLPSIREYLLLESRYMRADLYRKVGEQWTQTTVLADGDLVLASIGLTVPLAALYRRTGVPRTLTDTLASPLDGGSAR